MEYGGEDDDPDIITKSQIDDKGADIKNLNIITNCSNNNNQIVEVT
jgi:hypothetical protein